MSMKKKKREVIKNAPTNYKFSLKFDFYILLLTEVDSSMSWTTSKAHPIPRVNLIKKCKKMKQQQKNLPVATMSIIV